MFWAKFSQKMFLVENRKSEYHHQSQRFQISLSKKFDLKQIILIFRIKFAQNRSFWCKTKTKKKTKKRKKYERHYQHILIILSTKFRFKQTLLIFWTELAQKMVVLVQKKVIITIKFRLFKLAWIPNFYLKQVILTFWAKFAQKCRKNFAYCN